MTPLRVAIVADYAEEQWPSMDLVAEMLLDRLRAEHRETVNATLIRPEMPLRLSRIATSSRWRTIDRIAARMWDYPRHLRPLASAHDLFHIVDHSYAHLVHALPAERTVVTCHDVDTFRSVIDPEPENRSALFRRMTMRILEGVRRAAHVTCDTAATREALIRHAQVDAARTSVIHNGVHPIFTRLSDADADAHAGRLLAGTHDRIDVLHVGSTIPRKRIDVLLAVVAAVRRNGLPVRLVRVGTPFTREQARLARSLDVHDTIVLPHLERPVLAAVYRRCALLLMPSEREGFGLPVAEALACGTPVIASDIPALREVGGAATTYCAPRDIAEWQRAVVRLLDERRTHAADWERRRQIGADHAAGFDWSSYTAAMVAIYQRLAGQPAAC